MLLRGVGLTPLRPLPPPLVTSASSLPICLIAATTDDDLWTTLEPHGVSPSRAILKTREITRRTGLRHTSRSRETTWTVSLSLWTIGDTGKLPITTPSLECSQDGFRGRCLSRERANVSSRGDFNWRRGARNGDERGASTRHVLTSQHGE